ncbi:Stp1/IreP family PP2C-type Ser/Thr phosphatase [Olsenella sp. CA-Schmier-601-WT-1]|jgi:serine/threonine protein phosphatase PrpC|uniref:Stp1/IreP family PP2C-type Ser/Thr phosphatase n=2 Tax=Olsenella porci TaxID=2652279 RepID=A0A6N7XKC4_9ACTN|nr:Stp1/IreP family PP2C-type Ser/Thr phosphatase [Olsenella porci]
MIWRQPHRVNLAGMLPRHPQEEPVNSPGHDTIPVENREGAETRNGQTERLSWGARTDIGLVRGHNEDSFLVQPPLFAVCDGMGGHAAGEVASSIAVQTIGAQAPIHADDILLGAAVEAANAAVIEGAATGKGKPGMGCTASCVLIENNKMAIAHVGDSRIYLLHHGTLVRLTHDHSYVEELVDAGEITADEARVHPSRSIITRALGSDPDMYADHFTLDVSTGDRLIVCSDGLSSMVEDSEIEAIAVSSVTPQSAADNLTSAALSAGGHDNITVIVVDVSDDGAIEAHRTMRKRLIRRLLIFGGCLLAAMIAAGLVFVNSSWYLANNEGTVGIYQGITGSFMGIPLSHLEETTSVQISDLPDATQQSLIGGLRVGSEEEAKKTVESYRDQIDADKSSAAVTADRTTTSGSSDTADSSSSATKQNGGD